MNTNKRPSPEVIEALYELGVDAVTTTMDGLGVRRTFMQGPQIRIPGSKIVGPAITLRFVPNREDKIKGFKLPGADGEGIAEEEEAEKKSALWEIMYHVQPGDVLVAEQRGDIATGVVGEMLATYFKARGGIGIVTDGCVRDSKMISEEVGLPCWTTSLTTGGASHMNLYPLDFNLPIGCGKVLVEPGDIIMADNGGAIVVPPVLLPAILEKAGAKEEREIFIRMKLREGGEMKKYYPLNEEGQKEYEEWLVARQ